MDKGKEIINEPFWMHPDNEKENIGNNKMNGIYIKGISMPNGGTLKIEIGYDADGHPMALIENHDVFDVILIPYHGRLIDADALDMNYLHIRDDGMKIYTQRAIDNAPTIIPADKGY